MKCLSFIRVDPCLSLKLDLVCSFNFVFIDLSNTHHFYQGLPLHLLYNALYTIANFILKCSYISNRTQRQNFAMKLLYA